MSLSWRVEHKAIQDRSVCLSASLSVSVCLSLSLPMRRFKLSSLCFFLSSASAFFVFLFKCWDTVDFFSDSPFVFLLFLSVLGRFCFSSLDQHSQIHRYSLAEFCSLLLCICLCVFLLLLPPPPPFSFLLPPSSSLPSILLFFSLSALCSSSQVSVILGGVTECYECNPKTPPTTYAVCTIRITPDKPVHCVVWAKHLFAALFEENQEMNILSDMKV